MLTSWKVRASTFQCPTGSGPVTAKGPRPSQAPEDIWTKDGEDLSLGVNWQVQLCRSCLVCIHLTRADQAPQSLQRPPEDIVYAEEDDGVDPSRQSPHKLPASVPARSPNIIVAPIPCQAWHCKPMNEKSRNSDPRPSGPLIRELSIPGAL